MKVLLFVQTGDARPKCVKSFGWNGAASGRQYIAKIPFGEQGQPERGWLVECLDAEHGRGMIEHHLKHGEDAVPSAIGRIIASDEQWFHDDGATTPEGCER